MPKRYLALFATVVSFLLVVAIAPVFTQEFTDNKCYDEWDCGDGTTDESLYWWEAGWCAAAIEAGFISGTVYECTSTPDDDPVVVEDEETGKKIKYCEINFGDIFLDEDLYYKFKKTSGISEAGPVAESETSFGIKECPWLDDFLDVVFD